MAATRIWNYLIPQFKQPFLSPRLEKNIRTLPAATKPRHQWGTSSGRESSETNISPQQQNRDTNEEQVAAANQAKLSLTTPSNKTATQTKSK